MQTDEDVRETMGEGTDILTEAHKLVRGERLKFYGPPVKNFARVAGMWSTYLGIDEQVEDVHAALAELGDVIDLKNPKVLAAFNRTVDAADKVNGEITSNDVCCMMIALKIARIRTGGGYHRDSAVDAAGYAALLEILNDGAVDA